MLKIGNLQWMDLQKETGLYTNWKYGVLGDDGFKVAKQGNCGCCSSHRDGFLAQSNCEMEVGVKSSSLQFGDCYSRSLKAMDDRVWSCKDLVLIVRWVELKSIVFFFVLCQRHNS